LGLRLGFGLAQIFFACDPKDFITRKLRTSACANDVRACEPLPNAHFLVFHTMDEKWERPGHGYYYEVIDLKLAMQAQTILAYEMNRQPLPVLIGKRA
jgi:DMSO/TMAO reductase YedYZ molybdopterin-dependent catalytic subunit